MQQLTMPLGNRVRPERMRKERIHNNEKSKQAGDPTHPPTQHDQETYNQLEGAEYNRSGRYGSACEYAGADKQALEAKAYKDAWNQHAANYEESSVIHSLNDTVCFQLWLNSRDLYPLVVSPASIGF